MSYVGRDQNKMPRNNRGVISLFSGAGGLDLGFIQAGFRVAWANDNHADACKTYRRSVGDHIAEASIQNVSIDERPECDVVIGGPPCQGFSRAGKMSPTDPRSGLVWDLVRVVEAKRPALFVMENVAHLAVSPRWAGVREELLQQFQSLGYDVVVEVLDASQFGVPQQRERAFFLGSRIGHARDLVPHPNGSRSLSVREVLSELPPLGEPGNDAVCRAKIVPAKNPVLRASPYAGMLFNGQGRPIDLDGPAPTLHASAGGNKTPVIDQRAFDTNAKNWVEEYHAHLMARGEPLTSAPPFLRRLTVQECARLQTFPQDFVFCGSQCSQYRQIGNAVPPVLGAAIAAKVFRALSDPSKEGD